MPDNQINMEKHLYWNDPDPIKGNDYRVTLLIAFSDGYYFIKYNNGHSEAEVPIDELEIR